jgi:hypothetical protein
MNRESRRKEIATTAEYNHAPAGVPKNAFDSALFEWNNRPISFVGYGGMEARATSPVGTPPGTSATGMCAYPYVRM